MLLNNIRPCQTLQPFVRFYRIVDFDFTGAPDQLSQTKAYRPRIEHCLQFTPFDAETVTYPGKQGLSHKVALFGQQTVLTQRKVGKRFLNFQVVFQHGVLPALLSIPAESLSDIYCDAELLVGKRVHEINEQLAQCQGHAQMIEKVEDFLIQWMRARVPGVHPVNQIAGLISSAPDSAGMEWYASQANLSYRQFDRVFKMNTGITPKDFRMLIRLDRAYLMKNRFPEKDWLSIALECGFYDYQHLSRNYRRFTGYAPTSFYELERTAPERHFGDFEH